MTGLPVLALCTNLNLEQPNEMEACKHAGNASAVQLGIDANLTKIQKTAEKYADRKAKEYLNEQAAFVAATAYTIIHTRKVVYSVPILGKKAATTIEFHNTGYNVMIKYEF